MQETASIRELKANPARAIALTRQGMRVQITSHRKVVAEIVAPSVGLGGNQQGFPTMTDEEAVQKLVDAGLMEPATMPFKLGKAIKFPPGPKGQTMSDLVIELRGPR